MAYDFKNTTLPKLKPLKNSFANGTIEAEYRDLFLELYSEALAAKFFDVTVLGSAQLGSLDLVRKAINNDGLVMLEGDTEEVNTRRIYRAWMARNNQGRGLHFLRAYLQLIFPNVCDVDQLWQKKNLAYPLFAYSKRTNPDILDNPQDYYLTSRIEVSLDPNVDSKSVRKISAIARSIIPARLVPNFRFLITFLLEGAFSTDWLLALQKNLTLQQYWIDYYIEPDIEDAWNLGDDNYLLDAPILSLSKIRFTYRIDKYLITILSLDNLRIEPRKEDAWYLGNNDLVKEAPILEKKHIEFENKSETKFSQVTLWPTQDFLFRAEKFINIKAPILESYEDKLEKKIEILFNLKDRYIEPQEDDAWNLGDNNDPNKALKIDLNKFSVECVVERF